MNLRRNWGVISALVILFLMLSFQAVYSKDTVLIKGSTTLDPIAKEFARHYMSENPEIIVKVESSGSGFGAKAIINKQCDIGTMSRFMKDKEFKEAVENGVYPVFHHITRDGIALVVSIDNPVENLNLELIRRIYTGEITNWKQLGGKDREIYVISRASTSGTRKVFDELILKKGDSLVSDIEVVGNKDVEDLVIKSPNAIGYVGLGFLEGVKTLKVNNIKPSYSTINSGLYPLTRPLFMVTDGYPVKGSAAYEIVSMQRTPHGQEIIKNLGWFVSAKPKLLFLMKEIIEENLFFSFTVLVFLIGLFAFSLITSRMNINLKNVIKRRNEEIKNRLLAENALKNSEENLKITLYSIGDAVISTDVEGKIINMNPVSENLTGWEFDEAKGRLLEEVFHIIHAQTGETVDNPVNKCLQTGKIIGLGNHTVLISKTGREYQISDSAAPVKDNNGKIQGVVLIFRDVTDEYIIQRKLRESEEKYRSFLENFQGIAYQTIFREGFKPILFHGCSEEVTGYSSDEFIQQNKKWSEIIHPEDYNMVMNEREKLFSIPGYIARNEYRVIHKNGSVRWIYDIARIIRYESENDDVIQGTIYDVTERKRVEYALKDSEGRFRGLVENSPIGIISVDINGRIMHINSKLLEILGDFNADEIKGVNILEHENWKNTEFCESIRKSLHSGQQIHNIEEFESLNDRKYVLKYNLNPVRNPDGEIDSLIANIEDYTERKKVEKELHNITKLESIGTLAGGIAHNFKNILAAISLNNEIMKLMPEKLDGCTQKIDSSIRQANALANRFQSFTKNAEPVKEIADIRKVLEEADSIASSGSNITTVMELDGQLQNVFIDPKQMNEVFLNLIINAKQAMPNGGKLYYRASNVSLEDNQIGVLRAGNYVKLVFKDEGVGISQSNLSSIFDPFFTTKEDGNGLGLATVHYIIRKHGGHIMVQSQIGMGTKFTIYLPASENEIKKENEIKSKYKTGGYKKIILMDDDRTILESMKNIGQILEYEINCFSTGEQTIEEYKSSLLNGKKYEAVIIDLTNKEGMGGEQTIKELLKIDPQVKAIVFSGYSDKPIIAKYKEYGFKGRLDKPVSLNSLSQVLFDVINT